MDFSRQPSRDPTYVLQEGTHRSKAPPITGRRAFLRWATNALGGVIALVLGVPAVAFLLDPRHRKPTDAGWHDVVRIDELPVGVPQEFVIKEQVRDAWTYHPNEVVGRVFLIRKTDQTVVNDQNVSAFTTICPHLGCSVNFTGTTAPDEIAFRCPCHDGRFTIDGQRIDGGGYSNPAPRNMDQLQVRANPTTPQIVQVKLERFARG